MRINSLAKHLLIEINSLVKQHYQQILLLEIIMLVNLNLNYQRKYLLINICL